MNERWLQSHRLVHYTNSEEVVRSICDLGFLLVPNRRHLIKKFLPNEDFTAREPQEFGMVSFTELPADRTNEHREQFGSFGIAVKWEWALRNDAQRVIYVTEDGPVFETLQWLFELGRQEVHRCYPSNSRPTMLLQNKAVAGGYGAQLYHSLLTLYEYMEPEQNSSQVEWRIVNKIPDYTTDSSQPDRIERLLSAATTWRFGCVPISPSDIEMFVCPADRIGSLRELLPEPFRDIPILPFRSRSKLRYLIARSTNVIRQLLKKRERVVYVPSRPPDGVLLPRPAGGLPVDLPPVGKINGVSYYGNAVLARAFCTVQYEDVSGQWYTLRAPILDGLYLLNLLREMEVSCELEALNRPPQ